MRKSELIFTLCWRYAGFIVLTTQWYCCLQESDIKPKSTLILKKEKCLILQSQARVRQRWTRNRLSLEQSYSSSTPAASWKAKWMQFRCCWNEQNWQAKGQRSLKLLEREIPRSAEDMFTQQIGKCASKTEILRFHGTKSWVIFSSLGISWRKLLGYSQVILIEPSYKYWHCKYYKPANLFFSLLSPYK